MSTISEFVRAAIAAGLDELGFAEHYTLTPDGRQVSWSMPASGLPDYFRALHAARKEAGDRLIVRFGLEADFIPETVERLRETLAAYPLDYVIGSVHFVGDFLTDEDPSLWNALSPDERNDMIRDYWSCVARMAKSRVFDIVGHLELYKKFGNRPTIDISRDIAAALDAVAESGMAVELNTSGMHYAGEMYPSQAILLECHKRGIPSLVTADAHHIDHILRGYSAGVTELRSVGYTQQAVFEGRKMSLVDF